MPDDKTLATALVEFQAKMGPVAKTRTATIPGKDGKQGYSYKYADLGDIMATAQSVLADCGLAVTQSVGCDGKTVYVTTTVMHASGESFTTEPFGLPAGNTPQTAGSAATYARRYSYSGALGIASEDDDDGASATHSADAGTNQPRQATENQIKAVWGKAKSLGMDTDKVVAACKREAGVDHPDLLTYDAARAMLDKMQEAIDKQEVQP